jgi:putative peptidoglycan lipid II flippase
MTRPAPPAAGAGNRAGTQPQPAPAEAVPSLLQSGRVMALGTLASRGSGFLRTVVIAALLGDRVLADAYNVPNVLPNILFELLLGGVLTSVIVPLLVEAASRDGDGGTGYAQRLLLLTGLVLGGTSLIGILAAPALVDVYGSFTGEARGLAVTFTRFFLPQIFFYGVGATIGAILNTRGRFAAPMWTPVLNNLVVISTVVVYAALPGPGRGSPALLTTEQTLVLGIGTTAGIAVQTLALLPSLRGTGFRWRFRWDLRGVGLSRVARLAGWVLVYVVTNQLAYLVVVRLARLSAEASVGQAGGYSPFAYAYILFQLPYAVIAVSVITALLPRMSRHAVEGRLADVRRDLARGLRYSGALLVPASLLLVALGPLIGTLVFAHRNIRPDDARLIGFVLSAFSVGMVPFSVFQLQLRAFYALQDTRTPALVNLGMTGVQMALSLVAFYSLAPGHRVVGLALAFALSYVVGALWFGRLLRARLGPADGDWVVRAYVRLGLAALPAAGLALLVSRLVTGSRTVGPLVAALALLAAGVSAGLVFSLLARRLRVPEVAEVVRLLGGRLVGRLPPRR